MSVRDFLRRSARRNGDDVAAPEARPSIYEHVRSHVPAEGPGLTEGGAQLPDEPPTANGVRWMAGALDGVTGHHMSGEPDEARAAAVVRLIERAATGADREYRALEAGVPADDLLRLADPVAERLDRSRVSREQIRSLGRRLATTSADRGPVKLGIILLGRVPGGERDVLMTLGRHDEFTLYCAVALMHTEPDPEAALWELGRQAEGWGRIQVVERLEGTARGEIRDWILRQGFRNSVMNEYLAFIAADTGGLAPALEAESPDGELLEAAADIVGALIEGGPARGIDDYSDAPVAVERLVGHLHRRAATLHHYLAVRDLKRFLDGEEEAWERREAKGWPPGARDRLGATCAAILARPLWRELAAAGLSEPDAQVFYEAGLVARDLGIDTFDAHLARAAADPLGPAWYTLMQVADEPRIGQVIALAEAVLPLREIASGPARELGIGPGFEAHRALEWVVQDLKRFPGRGWELVHASLRSPVVRSRNMAAAALEAWGRDTWPAGADAAVAAAASIEPDPQLRERLDGLVAGLGRVAST